MVIIININRFYKCLLSTYDMSDTVKSAFHELKYMVGNKQTTVQGILNNVPQTS